MKTLTNELAEFFCSQTEKIIHKCNIITSNNVNDSVQSSIFYYPTNDNEIQNILNSFGENKAPGIDGIRTIDLKNHMDVFAPILCKFVNLSITESKIPALLKTAVVRPIYKRGAKDQLNNYRPISILPVIEKCLEGVIANRLQGFIDKHKLIHGSQYGFQKGKNSGKLLGEFTNCVNESLDRRQHILVIFMDFSKAFDTLNHSHLIEALRRIGIRGSLADWLTEYLQNRTFCVKIKDAVSANKVMRYGVPQGSKLGPILFILYTNELLRLFKRSTPFAFADDTAIVVRHSYLDTAINIIQDELNMAVRWCHDNGLVINASKTKMMHIRSPHFKQTDQRIYIQNDDCSTMQKECIEIVNKYKYLGVVIDSHFTWDKHIDKLRMDLKAAVFAISHLKYHTNHEVLKQVYFALMESKIRYGILAWGNAAQSHIKKIQGLQNAAIKQINNNFRQTNGPPFKPLQVADIYKMTTIIEYCDDDRFKKPIQHQFNTRRRAQGMLQIPRSYNNYGRRTLKHIVPSIINGLPQNIVVTQNFKKRKKELKTFLINNSDEIS